MKINFNKFLSLKHEGIGSKMDQEPKVVYTENDEKKKLNKKFLRQASILARVKVIEIDGAETRQWNVLINSTVHEKSYLFQYKKQVLHACVTVREVSS